MLEKECSRRKHFYLTEQSMILKRESFALREEFAERNLLSTVGRKLALTLFSNRTLGLSRHVSP